MATDEPKDLLRATDPIERALRTIDASGGRTAMVVDHEGRLIGTVSDGDLRRGFLRGLTLTSMVSEVMNSHPVVVDRNTDHESVLRIMRTSVLRHIPVVDQDRRVIALRTLEEFVAPQRRPNWVVIMAGGQGTRLRPLTGDCPKPMLPLGNRPLLQHTIEHLKELGFEKFFIAVNYMADVITAHFKDGAAFGVDIRYLREDIALGTAGALSLLPQKPDAPFVVMNGDIVTNLHFPAMLDFHNEHGAAATMGVREYEVQVPYGVIEIERMTISSIREKPTQRHIISGGVYVLSPQALDVVPRNVRYDMPQLFQDLQGASMQTVPFFIGDYWIDIGRIDDLTRAQSDFRKIFDDE